MTCHYFSLLAAATGGERLLAGSREQTSHLFKGPGFGEHIMQGEGSLGVMDDRMITVVGTSIRYSYFLKKK